MRLRVRVLYTALIGIVWLPFAGCSDATTAPTSGSIEAVIQTQTAANDADPDGYLLTVDNKPPRAVTINEVVTLDSLPTGQHFVALSGLESNCTVAGDNPRSVAVTGSGPMRIGFYVTCTPRVGKVRVTISTTGTDIDPDGYLLFLTGEPGVPVPANAVVEFGDIHEGPVLLEVKGVSGNCAVAINLQNLTVQLGATTNAAVNVQCVQAGGMRVTTTTSGGYLDTNGYTVNVMLQRDSSQISSFISNNGSVELSGMLGDYVVTLVDVAANCDFGDNPKNATVTGGNVSTFAFDITCSAPSELAFAVPTFNGTSIYVAPTNGTGEHRLSLNDKYADDDPAWSPDGSKIAFTSNRDGNYEIYVMNADGTQPTRLTSALGDDIEPSWSPDGRKIAFTSGRDAQTEIYVMSVDGSNQTRLTLNSVDVSSPAWSPDGSKIAFSSGVGGVFGIWTMNADGSGITRLTNGGIGDKAPDWSPDGMRIAFARVSLNRATSDIFLINADGSGLTQLTYDIPNAGDPAWSPDGRKIAVSSQPPFSNNCYYDFYCAPSVVIVGTSGVRYTDLAVSAARPAWRPR